MQYENKCWANVVFQALKSSPSIRNYVFKNLRGVIDEPSAIWRTLETRSFWESFLFSEKRDGRFEFCKDEKKRPPFRGPFYTECAFMRYLTIDIPWTFPSFGFTSRMSIGPRNALHEVMDALNVVDKAFSFSENKVFVEVLHNHSRKTNSHVGQTDGPVIHVSPLFPSDREDGKYVQSQEKGSIYKNRIKLNDEVYKKCLNSELKAMFDNKEFTFSNTGDVLIVGVDTVVASNCIIYSNTENAQSEYKVVSQMQAKPYLLLDGTFFVLITIIKHTAGNHFIVLTNGNLDQKWYSIDDASVDIVRTEAALAPSTSLEGAHGVYYFYQKITLDGDIDIDATESLLEENF